MPADFTDPTSLSRASLETGETFAPRFDADGLIPAIAQDADSGEVLMLAYMNAEALARTLATGEAHYWSRSRNTLWHKGATSGQTQTVVDLRTDCDQDTILMRVHANGDGGCCHVGYRSCFYRRAEDAARLAPPDVPKLSE